MREFLHVDDLADACLFLMEHYSDDVPHQRRHRRRPVDPRARREGRATSSHPTPSLRFDTSKPDGTPRKLLDVSRLRELGWEPTIDLDAGIRSTYEWFLRRKRTTSPSAASPRSWPAEMA